MSEAELKDGTRFYYTDQYETMVVSVLYGRTLQGYSAFKIWVNDKPVLISKSFISVSERLDKLTNQYGLRETESK